MKTLRIFCAISCLFVLVSGCQNDSKKETPKIQPAVVDTFNDCGFEEPATVSTITMKELPEIDVHSKFGSINYGGFSGLHYLGKRGEKWVFLTLTDRGPNAEKFDFDKDGILDRPFFFPEFQPTIVELLVDPAAETVEISKTWKLAHTDGTPVTGIPNIGIPDDKVFFDEAPFTTDGQKLALDRSGADTEGITIDDKGRIWIVEEYGPSLFRLNQNMQVEERYIPITPDYKTARYGKQVFPEYLAHRKRNRGFEGVAFHKGQLVIFLQSPIKNKNPDGSKVKMAKNRLVPVLTFDPDTEQVTGMYAYPLSFAKGKLGGAASFGNKMLVIEQLSKTKVGSQKRVYSVDFAGATNLLSREDLSVEVLLKNLNQQLLEEMDITPVKKSSFADLSESGFHNIEKFEGVAAIDDNTVVVINDNDFGVGVDLSDANSVEIPDSQLFILKRNCQ